VSNSGAYPQQPRFIGVYTMKKFKIKEPTIMRICKEATKAKNTNQKLTNHPQRQHWNDKVPKGGKNIKAMHCLRVSPIELMIP
jgi:hypothetical protein